MSPEITNRYPQVPWRGIVGMRHRVVHDYFAVDLDILWSAASVDVPRLAGEVRRILEDIASRG
ncbi:HepT-like ribonuclease domain-containing protein [Parafrankia colletiae]|uniref:HepT-like ribonuclease domain-containing protein n=1 Tax=Parafrankia colletiae TaxID=573497 RepID=UPI00389901C9